MRKADRKTFVIISVSDRVEDLNKLLLTIRNQSQFAGFDVCLLYQDYLGNKDKIRNDLVDRLYVYPDRLGCNGARVELIKKIWDKYDIFVNLDDDMELTPYTDYTNAVQKCLEPTTGFVLTNWARTESMMMAKVGKMKDKFTKQAFVYQGGGMVYHQDVAKLMSEIEVVKTVFDEGWPLTSYIHGYDNYRYLGSLAIHHICTSGGMKAYYASVDMSKLKNAYPQYVTYRTAKAGTGWCIPMDSDLTPLARKLHDENQKKILEEN